MYCYNCGAKAEGQYCANCGTKIMSEPAAPEAALPWRSETDMDKISRHKKVRELVAAYARESVKGVSATEFLGMVDKVFMPIPKVSLKQLSELIVPVYQRWGISTGKTATQHIDKTIQEVMVATLCSLAKNGYAINETQEAGNGILINAQLPSDIWTWGGTIIIVLEKMDNKTKVDISTKIKGQIFDWGKSRRVIKKIFNDLEHIVLPAD